MSLRIAFLALSLLAVGPLCQADSPPRATGPDAALRIFLREWTEKGQKVKHLDCEFQQTTWDRTWGAKVVRQGTITGTKPDFIRITFKAENGYPTYCYLISDTEVHMADYARGQRGRLLIPGKDGIRADLLWHKRLVYLFQGLAEGMRDLKDLLLNMPLSDLTSRYSVRLLKQSAGLAELELKPLGERQEQFESAHLVVDRKTGLVRHAKFVQHNGSVVLWTLERIETNVTPRPTVESLSEGLPPELNLPDELHWPEAKPLKAGE